MLQTLTDVTDEEIDILVHKSRERINNICNSKETIMDTLGITPYNTNMTPFQKSIKLYPSLINDTYTKDIIREIKNSLLKKYRSGKLEINGKYTFLLPDYYAACEHWFGQIKEPKGLLDDQEVFCWMSRQYDKLDCLRSPHLYKEHAIRANIASEGYGNRASNTRKWFTTNGLYASTHDLISKILMYDVDGDKALVVADKDFTRIAERNMKGIVPLYYNMRKSEPEEINMENIYAGLTAAFTGGNIGTYSNNISKIWNNNVFINGTEEEKQEAVNCVKMLCCQNNFVIDYAKTLYKPEFPQETSRKIAKYTNQKLPAFFEFAKDKEKTQLEKRNKSLVNRIYEKIPDKHINTRGMDFGNIEYQKMMSCKTIICDKKVSALYNKLNKQYRYMVNKEDNNNNNLRYVTCKTREQFCKLGYTDEIITDMLVEYLYGGNKRYKQLLWFCYGEYILNNLKKNITVKKTKYIQCANCGEWFEASVSSKKIRCIQCSALERKRINREYYLKNKTS